MASVRKRKGSAFWYACITLENGKQRQFSTGLEDKEEALAVAVAAERSARKFSEKPHQLRAALERIAEDFVPPEEVDPARWLMEWAAGRKGEVSAATFSTYQNTALEASAWLKRAGVRNFSAMTPRVMTDLRNHWAETNSPVTVNTKMKHLHAAFSSAPVPVNPVAEVQTLRQAQTRRREFRMAELDVLLPTLTGEWRAMVMLGLYTGQRMNDLAVLTWRQIDLEKRSICFTTSKTKALVALPLLDPAVDALADLPSADSPDARVFPEIYAMKKGSRSNRFRYLLHACGLAASPRGKKKRAGEPLVGRKGKRTTSELSFHSLRHSATSMLKAAGVSDAIARAIIGHESAQVSRAYTHLDMETMRAAMEKMPSVGNGVKQEAW